jgi:ribose transport system substrate-binding protein
MSPTRLRLLGAVFAAATLVVGLAACGTEETPTPTTSDAPKSYKLGFVNGATTEFHTCLEKAIKAEAQTLGSTVESANSGQDPAKELSNVENMLAKNVDALIVQTVNVDALKSSIAKAKEAGVPIYLTSVITEDTSSILGAAVVDLKGVGKLDAEWVAKDAAGKQTKAALISGAPGAASDLLAGGFKDNLPANVKLVSNQPGMFNRAKAQQVAENIIQANPDLEYAFVANEDMAFGALAAFEAAGKKVKIVTVNGTDSGIAAVKDGKFSATVANSATLTGQAAVQNTIKGLNGDREHPDHLDHQGQPGPGAEVLSCLRSADPPVS